MVSGFERIQSEKFPTTYQGCVVKQMEYVEPSLPKVQRNLQNVHSVEKSDENEVDLMKRARRIYQDENKNSSFNHEKAWAVLQKHAKCDAPDPAPVDLTEGENVHDQHVPAVNTDELFGPDQRPRPPAFEAWKDKDRTITRLEELRFLALSTNDLSPDDAYWINLQKKIKDKLRAQIPRDSNNQSDDSDE
uniref:Uncharacterized protein n=1 Tax=Tanacetum cinerariifolium TaxID=118510 RepID=A0A699J6U3_TANCI|nr:hypothetical protein [Tanacetum cinerariifolium]